MTTDCGAARGAAPLRGSACSQPRGAGRQPADDVDRGQPAVSPTDLALHRSRHLFVLNSGSGTVGAYRVLGALPLPVLAAMLSSSAIEPSRSTA
jgi:hypothetical protein